MVNLISLRSTINNYYLADQQQLISEQLSLLKGYHAERIEVYARHLVEAVRANKSSQCLSEAFLHEYQLNSAEGIILMSIAEALLRIPDTLTQDQFLQEKLTVADWKKHLQHSDSLLVNVSTGALLMTGKFEHLTLSGENYWQQGYGQLLSRLGAPVIRTAIRQAMFYLAAQFVIAETIETASQSAAQQNRYRFSFDMLGEAALTKDDAERYYQSYRHAITQLGKAAKNKDLLANPSISVKLSALCPRYEVLQQQRAIAEISERLLSLAKQAQTAGISLTIDAEETARLEMSLTIFENVFSDPELTDWNGFGLAVQAYQKRALAVIHWLAKLSERQHKQIPLRLVKGAYWDTEIKRAQQQGLSNYPVFTDKTVTDVAYLACAKSILSYQEAFYAQFATHNAHSIAALLEMAKHHSGFELQRLHGMGETLYQEILQQQAIPCRIYAPVGKYRDLLPYLVRRLLENGANNSFINQLENPQISIEAVLKDPVIRLRECPQHPITSMTLPEDIFAPVRKNSHGLNVNDLALLDNLQQDLDKLKQVSWQAYPLVNGSSYTGIARPVVNPFANKEIIGTVFEANSDTLQLAVKQATDAFKEWRLCPVEKRTQYLQNAATLLETHRLELVSLCIRETGRSITDALDEVREAVDFCRYYAHSALHLFQHPQTLPGPVGEENHLQHYGRGVFVCISPWNFPIALFIGQISAALAAGNTVIAKPAKPASLTAMRCTQLLHQAGIPGNVLQFLPMTGTQFGQQLIPEARISGVAFTGSTDTAQFINRQLAEHQQIKPFIAETGGQNVMLADSSALPEQLVHDALHSAFNSAGQRCSALRVLFVQNEIAAKVISLLIGAMQELRLGDPGHYATDIGPVINIQAVHSLNKHVELMRQQGKVLYQAKHHQDLNNGSFFPPSLLEISDLKQLEKEVFGPVLHIIRYASGNLADIVAAVNGSGYGLTLGIHSRIDANIRFIQRHVKVGNIYVNRNMIGAVVGSQPFGGMGLSGTGPKAGGPHYLQRFAVEQTITVNTAAIGGNVQLMAQGFRRR